MQTNNNNNSNQQPPPSIGQLIKIKLGNRDGTNVTAKVSESEQKNGINAVSVQNKEEEEDCEPCESLGLNQKSKEMFKRMSSSTIPTPQTSRDSDASYNTTTHSESSEAVNDSDDWKQEEPPDFNQLGRSTWTFLHTMAAYYPNKPSTLKKQQVSSILHAIPHVYPCNVCAKDFEQILVSNPPKVDSRSELSQWLCEAHNHVNEITGKPSFDCKNVEKRWRRFIDHVETTKSTKSSSSTTKQPSVNTLENSTQDSHK